jgi:hypothetical protein
MSLEAELQPLQQRLVELEKSDDRRSRAEQDAKVAKRAADDPHRWTVKLGGHVQLEYIRWANADPAIVNTSTAPGPEY